MSIRVGVMGVGVMGADHARRMHRNPGHIAAPFAGVVTLTVTEGDKVNAGEPIATIEAMKMEAAITAPRGGLISRVAIAPLQQVEGGDLLAAVTVAEETGPE